eukprot:jgi/Mesvir1/9023/Mv21308-RA.1
MNHRQTSAHFLHTTDDVDADTGAITQSIVARNDLEEMLAMAELSGRDFAAERQNVVVIAGEESLTEAGVQRMRERESLRRQAEDTHRKSLAVPRRPPWDATTSPEVLDQRERESFLAWRRALARLEENEDLVITPFEKNLDIWRQLWRVMERSDLLVTVVDARDPLLYRCIDLEDYAREIDPCKRCALLLNKADLLPVRIRRHWARYFKEKGIPHFWWSAKAQLDYDKEIRRQRALDPEWEPPVLTALPDEPLDLQPEEEAEEGDELLRVLTRDEAALKRQQRARAAGRRAPPRKPRAGGPAVVGLVGYPNVGKSSSMNALKGQKKAGVTATPGKTKHFQTVYIDPSLMLCDCPGLVFPSFTTSKAAMVCAGILPLVQITDPRGVGAVIADKVPRAELERAYGITLPKPKAHEDPNRPLTAGELLRTHAHARGYVTGRGLPDEVLSIRILVKDYLMGKLQHWELPPGVVDTARPVPKGVAVAATSGGSGASTQGEGQRGEGEALAAAEKLGELDISGADAGGGGIARPASGAASAAGRGKQPRPPSAGPKRAEYKLNKKGPRRKDRAWRAGKGYMGDGEVDEDELAVEVSAAARIQPVSAGGVPNQLPISIRL